MFWGFFLVCIKLSYWEKNDCQQMCLIEHDLGLDVKSHLLGSCTKTDVKDFISFFFPLQLYKSEKEIIFMWQHSTICTDRLFFGVAECSVDLKKHK